MEFPIILRRLLMAMVAIGLKMLVGFAILCESLKLLATVHQLDGVGKWRIAAQCTTPPLNVIIIIL